MFKEDIVTLSILELSDRMEIQHLLTRYCHPVDQLDWTAHRSVYTPDPVIDDVSAGPNRTVDQMVEFLSRALEKGVLIQDAISTSARTPSSPTVWQRV
jgi:hypothetical protein